MPPAVEVGKGVYDAQFLKAIDWATQVNEEDRPQTIAAWRRGALRRSRCGRGTAFRLGCLPESDSSGHAGRTGGYGQCVPVQPALQTGALAVVGVAILGTGLWMLGVPSSSIKPTVDTREESGSGQSTQPAALTRPAVGTPAVQDNPQTCDGQAQWARAQALDTAVAYRGFIGRYPGHPMSELAKERLAGLD